MYTLYTSFQIIPFKDGKPQFPKGRERAPEVRLDGTIDQIKDQLMRNFILLVAKNEFPNNSKEFELRCKELKGRWDIVTDINPLIPKY